MSESGLTREEGAAPQDRHSAAISLRLLWADLLDPSLLVIKVAYFTLLAGVVILWPMFSLHQKELGLTKSHTETVSAVGSCLNMLVPFLSGVIGDKLGNFKVFFTVVSLLTALSAGLFTLVPSAVVAAGATNASSSVDEEQLQVTFWSYLAVRTSFGVLQAMVYVLFEAAVMANMQEREVNYGFQRAWGIVAAAVSAFFSGKLVELTGGYSVNFYISAALHVLMAVLVHFLTLDFKVPTRTLTRKILKFIWRLEVLIFLSLMFFAGAFARYIEAILYRFLLEDLHASPFLVGLTVTVGAPFELVMTLLTSFVVQKAGHHFIFVFGLFILAVRFFSLSFLVDPWWVLAIEAVESISNGLLFTAAVMYCTALFSLDTIASFRGLLGVVNGGIGPMLGTVVGSKVRETLGIRVAFRVMSGAALACCIAYAFIYLALSRWRSDQGDVTASTSPTRRPDQPPANPTAKGTAAGITNPALTPDD